MSEFGKANINRTELGFDAWGRNKVVFDHSLYHAMFTYAIDNSMFITYVNDVEIIGGDPLASSVDGLASIQSGATKTSIVSRRHPRYQPDRGHLYSSSMLFPDDTALGIRNFGIFTAENGAFFRLRDGTLYAVVRTTPDSLITAEDEVEIDTTGLDLTKGNIFDIQMQWRGVGNIKFFINLKEVILKDYLGTLPSLSIANPALPIAFEAINNGEACTLLCGCTDISSEGGTTETKQYRSIASSEVTLSTAETPILLFNIQDLYNSKLNTRDCVLLNIEAYADDDSLLKVYYGRDSTAFTVASWTPSLSGLQQYAPDGDITAVDYAKLTKLHETRVPINGNTSVGNPDNENTDFYLASGDYILITLKAKNNTLGGATMIYGEEI